MYPANRAEINSHWRLTARGAYREPVYALLPLVSPLMLRAMIYLMRDIRRQYSRFTMESQCNLLNRFSPETFLWRTQGQLTHAAKMGHGQKIPSHTQLILQNPALTRIQASKRMANALLIFMVIFTSSRKLHL